MIKKVVKTNIHEFSTGEIENILINQLQRTDQLGTADGEKMTFDWQVDSDTKMVFGCTVTIQDLVE